MYEERKNRVFFSPQKRYDTEETGGPEWTHKIERIWLVDKGHVTPYDWFAPI